MVGAVGEYVEKEIHRLCDQKEDVELLELNVQKDHVHMVISLAPKYSISSFMGYLKGKLAIRIFTRYESMAKRYWGRHFWSRGYCVTTIGLDEEKIRQYVKWQEDREKRIEKEIQGELFE